MDGKYCNFCPENGQISFINAKLLIKLRKLTKAAIYCAKQFTIVRKHALP